MREIFFGVISGVLTTLLLVGTVFLFNKGILPWYRRLIYKGVEIHGTWSADYLAANGSVEFRLTLVQSANRIRGSLVVVQETEGGQDIADLSLQGELWEGFLNATLRSNDSERLSFACMLLKVSQGGGELTGQYLLRNLLTDRIDALPLTFARKGK